MNLSKKFTILLVWTILFIIFANILALSLFVQSFFDRYLKDKEDINVKITTQYIESIIQRDANDYIDKFFQDVELDFEELLKRNNWEVSLDKEENVDIIVNYLIEKWVWAKYIKDLIPKTSLSTILLKAQDNESNEHKFISELTKSMVIINLILITFLLFVMYIVSKKIISPIKETTKKLSNFKIWKDFDKIIYNKNDEIWLLVNSINKLNKNLKIQEEIRGTFLANISHELKTPITSIRLYLEGINDWVIKLDSPTLNHIIEEMQRLVKLVNSIMNYEKFENSEIKINKEKTNIKELIEWIKSQYEPSLISSKQSIEIISEEDFKEVDKEKFSQITQNIIWNFLKYAGRGTTLRINLKEDYINFSDNWSWIKESKVPFLLEKFYQWDKSKTWRADDRWIWVWLSIVEKIVKAHWWSIDVWSKENEGFAIRIFTKTSH